MSIVGCYTLDLYCENARFEDSDQYQVDLTHQFTRVDFQFTGKNERDCLKQARKSGWKFDLKNNKAYCPLCKGKELAASDDSEETR